MINFIKCQKFNMLRKSFTNGKWKEIRELRFTECSTGRPFRLVLSLSLFLKPMASR